AGCGSHPRADSPPPCADTPRCLWERHLRRPSPPAEPAKRFQDQILKLNGFVKRYCQIKWTFSTILVQNNSLILLKYNSQAKMDPDTHRINHPVVREIEFPVQVEMRPGGGR